AVPRGRIAAIPVSERRVVHHVLLVAISLFSRGEIGEAVLLWKKCYRLESEWLIQFLLHEYVEWLTTHMLDDVAEQHEAEIAVMATFANAPLQRHVAYDLVRLVLVGCVVVQRLPLYETGGVREQIANGDAVEMRPAEVRQVSVNRRIHVHLSTIDEHHHRERRCHHLRHR